MAKSEKISIKGTLFENFKLKITDLKFRIPNSKNYRVLYPRSLSFSQKVSSFLTYFIVSACL